LGAAADPIGRGPPIGVAIVVAQWLILSPVRDKMIRSDRGQKPCFGREVVRQVLKDSVDKS